LRHIFWDIWPKDANGSISTRYIDEILAIVKDRTGVPYRLQVGEVILEIDHSRSGYHIFGRPWPILTRIGAAGSLWRVCLLGPADIVARNRHNIFMSKSDQLPYLGAAFHCA